VEVFSTYARQTGSLAKRVSLGKEELSSPKVLAALDGEPGRVLRKELGREKQRDLGAFFTGKRLAKALVSPFRGELKRGSVVLDPACGAGDLLLAALDLFSTRGPAARRIETLSQSLIGRDLVDSFARTARARLLLRALETTAHRGTISKEAVRSAFVNVTDGRGDADMPALESATHVVMNPPFSKVIAEADCEWAAGSVNEAAVFFVACLDELRAGTRVRAILPDVLRSGSRYSKWRDYVTSRSDIDSVIPYGLFDRWTDVDVFLLGLTRRARPKRKRSLWSYPRGKGARIRDQFDIAVGSVVDYRDPREGRWHPFLCARSLRPWKSLSDMQRRRRFKGRTFDPPFVAIRRTSRPGDSHRAVGTLVESSRPVAVENHVIVCLPKDGTKRACRQLMRSLKDARSTAWLDKRIRCRHLTVEALAVVPLFGAEDA
jgi:hypothetical protein